MNTSENIIAKSAKIAEHSDNCILALINFDGYPTAATISPSKVEGIKRIYFGNNASSNWVQRIERCNRASICFSSDNPVYNITLVGDFEIITDQLSVKQEMWRDWMNEYFSGPEDSNYCVLRFTTRYVSIFLDGTQYRGELTG
ncbi:MAG: pyridoxamine 5'-phosphate oxidase family protein [Lachnospiraceae bacterium]|nr:pyridoxamine 5'-phosphate oxidase family protein [Lachnospiraceae bacterium]